MIMPVQLLIPLFKKEKDEEIEWSKATNKPKLKVTHLNVLKFLERRFESRCWYTKGYITSPAKMFYIAKFYQKNWLVDFSHRHWKHKTKNPFPHTFSSFCYFSFCASSNLHRSPQLISTRGLDSLRNRDEAPSAKLEKDRTETFVNQKRCYSNKMASSSVGFGADKRQCLDVDILLDSCSRLRLAMTECCSTRPSLPAGEKPHQLPSPQNKHHLCSLGYWLVYYRAHLYLLSNELNLKVTGWF